MNSISSLDMFCYQGRLVVALLDLPQLGAPNCGGK